MPKRGENIRKRKDGRWEGRIKLECSNDGKSKYKSIYGKTYIEVKRRMAASKKENAFVRTERKEITYGEILEHWQKANKIKHKTATNIKYDYMIDKHIKPILKDVKLGKINTGMLNDFLLDKLYNGRIDNKGGLSPSYVRTMMIIINSSLVYSYEQGYSNFIRAKVPLPPIPKEDPKILSMTEQKKLEQYIIDNLTPTNIGIMIALRTGLRVGEICALTWSNIDFDSRTLHVGNTIVRTNSKGDFNCPFIIDKPKTLTSIRDVPISDFLVNLLQKIKCNSKSEFVVSEKATFISPTTFEYRYHKTLRLSGIKDINFHGLRHTFATRCIEAGIDDKTLSEILGHSNVSITLNTYVHSSLELKRQQMDKLSKMICGT